LTNYFSLTLTSLSQQKNKNKKNTRTQTIYFSLQLKIRIDSGFMKSEIIYVVLLVLSFFVLTIFLGFFGIPIFIILAYFVYARLRRASKQQLRETASTLQETQPAKETQQDREIIREKEVIVKIRCSFCNNLYDETLDKCPHCGGHT
jgi:Ca2+-dependent lipid-binding protein